MEMCGSKPVFGWWGGKSTVLVATEEAVATGSRES